MNIPEEDNGITIFEQLKHMFFQDDPDQEDIVRLIREEPLLHVNRMLLMVTQEYSRKLDEIVEPLREERDHLAITLAEQREKLGNCLDDVEFLKNLIDQLEEDHKDVSARLNKTLEEKESSRIEAILQIGESEKLKHEAGKLYVNYQQIYDQNTKFKEINYALQSDLTTLKTTNLALKSDNEKSLAHNIEITNKFHLLSRELQQQRQQNHNLHQRIIQKQEFIASFVEEYNNFHFFSQQDREEEEAVENKEEEKWAGKNQLKQFNFNSFVDEDACSQKSSNEASSTRKLSTQMDSTSKHEQQHLNVKFQTPNGFKKSRANMRKPSGFGSSHIQIKDKYGTSVRGGMSKAISWRNLHENKTAKQPQSPQEEERMMETVLRNKIHEKNERIIELENEMMQLRMEFIEQRENITVMEGEYELEIEEINRQLAFIKQQLILTQQRQLLARIQSESYSEKNRELEDELQAMREEHTTYRQQLKMKCKAFVVERMEEMQRYHERLNSQAQLQNIAHIEAAKQKEQINSGLQEEEKEQIISFSEIQSFHQLPSHYINTASFDLNLSNCKLTERKHEEIGSSEMFQIQSDLGNFTERMQLEDIEDSRTKMDGNFTERVIAQPSSLLDQHKEGSNQIESNLCEVVIGLKAKHITVAQQPNIQIPATIKGHKFSITQSVAQVYAPTSKAHNLYITSSIESVMSTPRSKIYAITKTLQTMIPSTRMERNQIRPTYKLDLQVAKKRNHTLSSQLVKISHKPKVQPLSREWTQFTSLQSDNRRVNEYQADEQKYLQTSPSTASFIGLFLHRLSLNSNTVDVLIDKQVKIFNQHTQHESHMQLSRSRASTFNSVCQMPKIPMPYSPRADLFGKGVRQSNYDMVQTSNVWRDDVQEQPKYKCNYFKNDLNLKQKTFSFNNDELSQSDKNVPETTIKQTENQSPSVDNANTIKKIDSPRSTPEQTNKEETERMDIPCLKLAFKDSPDTSFEYLHHANRSELKQSLSLSLCSEKQQFSFSFEHCMKEDRKGLQTERSPATPIFTPAEIEAKLTADQNALLSKYLQNHKLTLKYEKVVEKSNFKKPSELDKKILIVSGRSKNEVQTFLMNSYQIYSLESGRNIKFEKSKYVNQNNFMFGQSEVMVTGNGHLVVNRAGKKKKLAGNLEDGDWLIDSYIVCGYSTVL